ncbi:D-amino-acid transaminase [Rhizobium sp. CG4]|jgi:D-alanine transaminase|uniref:D-amino-acid transaminase n=1 Tax=unclassified Rhizobium TaxID=2613769 RepID=UPI002033505A|nr:MULTISPECIES: D-amino-acid transaminase [unclassified Rhizobium]MCM2457820.1 D-amino-acid transaminase [Rhizobium sp. CG4]MCS4243292.1 D-alanine transaminase [Rhizobium sp. BIGb0125]
MSRTVYVNGEWVAEENAKVSVFDRGYLFADAIYEVTAVANGRLIDFTGHAARLARSLEALGIKPPVTNDVLKSLHFEIIRRNELTNGLIYLQISRGAEDRDFLYSASLEPTIVMFTQARNVLANPRWETGISVATVPEGRWSNRQIKTVQLLYSSMAKMEVQRKGADDALFVEDGFITEGTSNNFHIVTSDGTLITRALSNALLHGITRGSILDIADKAGIPTEQRSFTPDEAKSAAEAFITSAGVFVMPVIAIDGQNIGDGKPGPISQKLRALYIQHSLDTSEGP